MSFAASLLSGTLLFAVTYFDAHNHITGVLPYQAYADLPAFIRGIADSRQTVTTEDRLALYGYLANTWYTSKGAALGDTLFSPADGQRFALGARAALVVYRNEVAGSLTALNGTLERVLTATPWSEFDSAYAFRAGPAGEYLRDRFYGGNDKRLNADLCKATILDLAATNIDASEQSLPFVGGWRFHNGTSGALDWIDCVMHASADSQLRANLHEMNRGIPTVKIVLMTHTAQLATLPGGKTYSEWSKTGFCGAARLVSGLVTTPKMVYDALMGWNAGKAVFSAADARAYFDDVVGIDTAGPETTCFSPQGMEYYRQLIKAVYDASKSRRLAGWHGKLLVHTHVGEGGLVDFAPNPPPEPWSFQEVFATLPPTRTNAAQARENISILLAAISQFELAHPDTHDYVIFRLAHATWDTPEQALAMHAERAEADVNLESNVATDAYPVARMPLGAEILKDRIQPLARNPATNFELNDLLGTLISDPRNASQVGGVLGNAALKYLLEAHVRCLLGSDADGVEHSDIVKEYAYAASLITYWDRTDPAFRLRSDNATIQTLFANVQAHLRDMASDRKDRS